MSKLTRVTAIDDVFTPEECLEIVRMGKRTGFGKGPSYDAGSDTPIENDDIRICNSLTLDPEVHEWIYTRVMFASRQANLFYEFDLDGPVTLYLLQYPEHGHIVSHADGLSDLTEKRKLSVSVQLTRPRDYDGGELVFAGGHIAEKRQGTANFFSSVIMHRVLPVLGGERYAIIGWFEGKRAFK